MRAWLRRLLRRRQWSESTYCPVEPGPREVIPLPPLDYKLIAYTERGGHPTCPVGPEPVPWRNE